MSSARLTARIVSSATPQNRLYIIYDTDLPGFGLRVMPSGHKSWLVEYRPAGGGRNASKKRLALGSAAALTAVEARRLAKNTLAGVREGRDPLADRRSERKALSVAELAQSFLTEHVARHRKPNTVALYRHVVDHHLVPALGAKKASLVTRQDVLRLHVALHGTPVMANRVLAVIGSMYGWAATVGAVPEGFNPAGHVQKNREQGCERYLRGDELERLGAALREAETTGLPWEIDASKPLSKHLAKDENRRTLVSPYAIAAVRLLLLTGCRLREILHLRWSDVDFERGMLHLADSKTGRKSIVLNGPALSVVEAVPRVGKYVVAGRGPKNGRVADERPRSDLKKPWSAIRQRAGLDGVRIHDLRHSFASVGAGGGFGLPIVGKLLGHAHPSTTQRYAHLDNDPLRRASNAIGATIAAALEGRPGGEKVASFPTGAPNEA